MVLVMVIRRRRRRGRRNRIMMPMRRIAEMTARMICILSKGGAPDYQLVYFFWEKGKVAVQIRL